MTSLKRIRLEKKIKDDTVTLNKKNNEFYKLLSENLKSREESIQVAKNVYEVISTEYNELLDPRDWKNIDLIIFCFETGRADTMKEALIHVDGLVQREQILDAINTASMQIQNTIRSGLEKIHIDMLKCFSVISNQLNNISIGIGEQNARLTQMSKKIDLNNALLEKSSKSSNQLAEDVHYIRLIAENEDIRKRNNPKNN